MPHTEADKEATASKMPPRAQYSGVEEKMKCRGISSRWWKGAENAVFLTSGPL